MNAEKILPRLIKNIKNGKFAYKRYRETKTYYGVELHTDVIYKNDGGFGLSVIEDGKCKYWIWRHIALGQLNINGFDCERFLKDMAE